MDVPPFLDDLAGETLDRFSREKRVLSFSQYLDLFMHRPGLLGGNAAQYFWDTLEFYGT